MANSFVNKKVDLTGVSATTLYTIPTATTAVIRSILVSDDSGSGDTITVTITAGSDVFSLFKVKAIGANATVELLTGPLVVQESEVLKVTAATANRLHVVLSALEIKPRIVTT
jgi:chorismate mutase